MYPPRSYRFGDFELDVSQRRLSGAGREIPLQPKVFETLLYLVERAQRVVSKGELLEAVWAGSFVTENALSRCIRQIRRALDDDARAPTFLRTIPRVGYQFVGALEAPPEETSRKPETSIMVLPFHSPGSSSEDGLALGMADTLITRLSRVHSLRVRPLSATRRYKAGEQDAIEVGTEQRAELVIDGGIQEASGRLRVSARLIRVADGRHLLANQFDRPRDELFDIQDLICAQILGALELELTDHQRQLMARRHTSDPEAYRLYLLGRLHAGKQTPSSAERGIEYFELAIDRDPANALAWSGLAEALISLGTVGIDSADYYEQTRRAANRALALAGDLSDPYRCLAQVAWQHDWTWDEAERLFRRALDLDPNSTETRTAYSDFCCYLRRPGEGEAQARAAIDIDPVSPWSYTLVAQALHMQRRDAEALEQAERALEIDPEFAFARFFAGLAALHCDRTEEAIGNLERAFASSGRHDFGGALGYAYAQVGQPERTRSLLAEMRDEAPGTTVPPIAFALLEMALGERDAAFRHLQRCVEQRSWHVLLVYAEPIFADLRSDPRATKLFERLGLPTG